MTGRTLPEREIPKLLTFFGDPKLREDVVWLFEQQPAEPHWQRREQGHGREEIRELWVLGELSFLEDAQRAAWRDLYEFL